MAKSAPTDSHRSTVRSSTSAWLERLEADGFVHRTPRGVRLTRRWHGALARTSMQLFQRGDTLVDIRTPVAQTLVEIYDDEPDECLASAISALLPIVIAELSHTAALMGEVQNS